MFDVGETVLQRYRIESLLSEDALGYTYTVSEIATAGEADRALRVLRLLRARLGSSGVRLPDEAVSTWRTQLEHAQDLRHPGIPPIEEMCFGDEHGRVYIVRTAVELEGQPLSALLAARPAGLSESEAVRLLAQIAEVVEVAHQKSILHLSLSPSRIFVVPSGDTVAVRVADFALLPPALAAAFGEPGYLSPEQVEGQPCDRRTDQFSLAVILYEMLSSQPAFIGAPDEDRQVTLSRVQHEDPLPLALSRPLEQALARALSRSRAVRFPSLHDFVRALGIDGVAWSLVLPPGSTKSPPPARPRGPLWQSVLVGAGISLVGVSLVWWLLLRPEGGDPRLAIDGAATEKTAPSGATGMQGPVAVGPGGQVGGTTAARVDLGGALSQAVPATAAADPALLTGGNRVGAGPTAAGDNTGPAAPKPTGPTATPGIATVTGVTPGAGRPQPSPPSGGGAGAGGGTSAIAAVKPSAAGTTGVGSGTGAVRPGGGTPAGTQTGSPPAVRPTAVAMGAESQIDIAAADGGSLPAGAKEPILGCIRMIRPATPFRVVLENINGMLYVSERSPQNELRQSTDFRNCLKTEFHGKIEAKELSLKGFLRSKTSP